MAGAATTARSGSTTCACRARTCSVAAGTATCSDRRASVPHGSRTACAGSVRSRLRSRCSSARAEERQLHGAPLADKQAIQWMMADSAMELYAAKLMVLHAAYKIEHGLPFRQEVSFAKHHVANTLWRVVDRADPGARCARLLGRHAARAHAPARALGATRRRCRRGAPGAHRPQPAGGLGRDRLARRGDRRPLLLRPRSF